MNSTKRYRSSALETGVALRMPWGHTEPMYNWRTNGELYSRQGRSTDWKSSLEMLKNKEKKDYQVVNKIVNLIVKTNNKWRAVLKLWEVKTE